jgi:hypothetical protein
MSLQDIVTIFITTENLGVTQAGFGVPLILSADADFAERIRFYEDITAVEDDFATTTATYKAAQAIFSQNPKPEKIAIGRLANKPTTKFTVSVKTVRNSYKYRVRFGSTTYEFTSDANAANDEIVAGLEAAIDADPVTGFTASVTGDVGSQVLELVADAAGNWAAAEVLGRETDDLEILQGHADPGVAADLAAIQTADNTWYGIINPYNSKAMALAVAGWAEANEKLFVCASQDSNNESLADGADASASLFKALEAAAYARTLPLFHPANDAFADAAWAGACLPLEPGSETWAFKTLAGVPVVEHTATEKTNIRAKNGNLYIVFGGRNATHEGLVSAGEYVDVVRGRDWLKARMSERIAGRILGSKKIPYTDAGVSVLQGDVQAQLDEAVTQGLLSPDPAPAVVAPKVASASPADKAARTLRSMKWSGTLAGAIHKLNIQGVLSV